MPELNILLLVSAFLTANFEDFQEYLENVHEIEGTEAEMIIGKLMERIDGLT